MYHRISQNKFYSNINVEDFETQISYIKNNYRVVSVDQLIGELKDGTGLPNTIALTFDDGYRDFYDNAWPILKRHGLPATVYVPSDFIDGEQWLWPDKIKYILMVSVGHTMDLPILGSIQLNEYNLETSWSRLADHCLTLPAKDQNDFIETIATKAHVTLPLTPTADFSAVTWAQLSEMQAEGLSIGSHTVTHPVLSMLNPEYLNFELEKSSSRIKQMTGKAPMGICYPYGRVQDINESVINATINQGYQYGLMACNVTVNSKNLFTIGRLAADKSLNDYKWTLSGARKVIKMDNTLAC